MEKLKVGDTFKVRGIEITIKEGDLVKFKNYNSNHSVELWSGDGRALKGHGMYAQRYIGLTKRIIKQLPFKLIDANYIGVLRYKF